MASVVESFLEPLRHLGYRPMVRISGLGLDPEPVLITQLVDLLICDKFWIGGPEGAESRNQLRSSIPPIPITR